ncbi:hypothetical protein [Microvirga aerophila]|uniref:Lipoprotein n=1 Tax=Microvirga aerophila TaxID=670291 RepID=A0A512C4L7_9HYPH|nr:hypothetical protein [Microvirga aerophila]GEO19007.1 hypothetical protein MAE02_67030 [Microvirga aerophila]
MFTVQSRVMPLVVALLAGVPAGCAATADLSYSEYQFGPGYGAERVYESRVYGDTEQGLGSEVCWGSVRREMNAFGDMIVRDDRACDGIDPGFPDQP